MALNSQAFTKPVILSHVFKRLQMPSNAGTGGTQSVHLLAQEERPISRPDTKADTSQA